MVTGPDDHVRRRELLDWAKSVGLYGLCPATFSSLASAEEQPSGASQGATADGQRTIPDSVSDDVRGDPGAPVSLPHPLEVSSARERVNSYEESGDPTTLYGKGLKEYLKDPEEERIMISVKTIGEQNSIVTQGHHERELHGWKPRSSELPEGAGHIQQHGLPRHLPRRSGEGGAVVRCVRRVLQNGLMPTGRHITA